MFIYRLKKVFPHALFVAVLLVCTATLDATDAPSAGIMTMTSATDG